MKLWIVCANPDGARIFRCERLEDGVRFYREIPHPGNVAAQGEFAKYVAEELDLAVGQGEAEKILLAAEPEFLTRIVADLGGAALSALQGVVEQDLYQVNESDLASYVRDYTPRNREAA
jgi:hypothetical protein